MEASWETAGVGLGAVGVCWLFLRKLVTGWSEDKKEVTKDNAESALYQNLVAENERMSGQISTLSEQVQKLMMANIEHQIEIGSLRRYIQSKEGWDVADIDRRKSEEKNETH